MMAIRKLLLPLTGTAAGEAALSTCLMIARVMECPRHGHSTSASTAAMSRRSPARACPVR